MKTRYPIYCNKDLVGEVGREVPYDKVRNGTRTPDEYLALTTDLYADNGNGVVDNKDTFGYTAVCDTNINSFMQASEIYVVTRHGDGSNFDWDYYNSYVIQPMLPTAASPPSAVPSPTAQAPSRP